MSDKDWCEQHNISRSTFYHHIKKLRNNACQLPERYHKCQATVQQVVELPVMEEEPDRPINQLMDDIPCVFQKEGLQPAISVHVGKITVDISNGAAEDTIRNTLKWLPSLC